MKHMIAWLESKIIVPQNNQTQIEQEQDCVVNK
jgi:hypothetical protein